MQLPRFEYVRAATLDEGLAALAEHGADAKIISGGSDLLVNMKMRLDTPRVLISLGGIAELRVIEDTPDGGLRIGAGCRLTDLIAHPAVGARFPALRDAMAAVGSRHVRNIGTIGGNLCLETRCWYTNQSEDWRKSRHGCFKTDRDACHVIKTASRCHAINSSDTAPALIALDASVVLAGPAGRRTVRVLDFFRDDGVQHTILAPDELLVAILVPDDGRKAVFAKLAQRVGLDYAAGSFAAAVRGPAAAPEAVRLVLNAVGAAPTALTESERQLTASGLTDAAIDAAALGARRSLGEVTNLFTPSGYKRRLIRALIRDALVALRDQAA